MLDELLWTLLAIAAALLLLSGPILGWAAFFRLRRLETELAGLRSRLAGIEAVAPGGTAPATPAPPEPPPREEAVAPGPVAEAEPRAPEAEAEAAVPEAAPEPLPPPADAERRLAERWLVRLGAVALGLGGLFLAGWAIEQGLLGPRARVGLAARARGRAERAQPRPRRGGRQGAGEPAEEASPATERRAGARGMHGAMMGRGRGVAQARGPARPRSPDVPMAATLAFCRQYLRPRPHAVETLEVLYRRGAHTLPATLYRPAGRGGPRPGWVLLHGLTCRARAHPALDRFARAVAAAGSLVLVPEVPEWRRLRPAPARTLPTIPAAIRALASLEGADPDRIGVIGFSFGATQALIAAAAERGARQMVAVIGDSANAASIALHRACGFTHVGTLRAIGFKAGRWLDSVLMQRPLGEGSASPPGPPRG